MGRKTLNLATRGSQLALVQVEEALPVLKRCLPEFSFEVLLCGTPGDRDLDIPLSHQEVPDDFFTRDLDQAILEGKADLAVHSAKDLPADMPEGLTVAALLPAQDIRDAIVFRSGWEAGKPPRTIGTSSPRRADYIRDLYPEAEARPIRGAIPSRMDQLDRGDFDALIVAACALHRLGLAERIGEYLPYDPAPQQGRLAIVTRTEREDLRAALRAIDIRRHAGLVAIVGCSADAALLSERARTYLKEADIVFHDRLLPESVLLEIADKAVPSGKAGGEKSVPQSEIHRALLGAAEKGKLAVRLKGGDPGVFGHLAEELQFLNDWSIRTDVVPAVTAAQISAARAHAPLTDRKSSRGFSAISATPSRHAVEDRFPGPEAGHLAIYMPVKELKQVAARLAATGWPPDTPITVGERLGYKDEALHQATLATMPDLKLERPAIVLVGVQSFAPRNTALFVGTEPGHFLKYGPLIHWPLIELADRPLAERAEFIRSKLHSLDGVLLPGRHAVRSLLDALMVVGDTRLLAGKKVLAVGPATADELAHHGLKADLAAKSLGGVRALVRDLDDSFRGRYLYPCSDAAPQDQRKALFGEFGIELVPQIFYTNCPAPFKELPRLPFARVLFTSSSTVQVYFDSYPGELSAARTWIAVGPSTLEALQGRGLEAELLEPELPPYA